MIAQKFVDHGLSPSQIEMLKQQNVKLSKSLEEAQEGELLAKQEKEAYRTTMERILESHTQECTTHSNFQEVTELQGHRGTSRRSNTQLSAVSARLQMAVSTAASAASRQAAGLRGNNAQHTE